MEEKGPDFFIEVQSEIVEELRAMLVKSYERHEEVRANGDIITEEWDKKQDEMREMIETTIRRAGRTLKYNLQAVGWHVHHFRSKLREVLALYVAVNNQMKVEEKQAAKQDAFIALMEESSKELAELKESMKVTQAMFAPQNPGCVISRTNISTEKLMNHIEEPYRPMETEVATAVQRVNAEMMTLSKEIPMARTLPKLMSPIEERGMKVAAMMLKEFQPKTIDDFLNTLPLKQRD